MLELKHTTTEAAELMGSAYNRTMLELKLLMEFNPLTTLAAYNRTMLELKHVSLDCCFAAATLIIVQCLN